MSYTLKDESPQTGVFEGDLKYGRCQKAEFIRRMDFPANRSHRNGTAKNRPVAPLVLVKPRDPNLWKRDEKLKEAKRSVGRSQHPVNYLLIQYHNNVDQLRANIHITLGQSKF